MRALTFIPYLKLTITLKLYCFLQCINGPRKKNLIPYCLWLLFPQNYSNTWNIALTNAFPFTSIPSVSTWVKVLTTVQLLPTEVMNNPLSYSTWAAIAKHHWLSGLNNNKDISFLTVLEAGNLRSEIWHGKVLLREFSSWLADDCFLVFLHGKDRELSLSSFPDRSTSAVGLEPHPYDFINLNYLLKKPYLQIQSH